MEERVLPAYLLFPNNLETGRFDQKPVLETGGSKMQS